MTDPVSAIRMPQMDVPGCCTPRSAPPIDESNGTLFHFSLNVSDMERSIAFYRVLFGAAPAKHYPDYAKFELSQPPLVFSLVPNPPGSGGTLSHFGFPVSHSAEVDAIGARLAAAGLNTSCQKDTVCGYARQDKVWVADPDHNYWEIYVVHEDVDPETVRSGFDGVPPKPVPFNSPDPTVGETVPVLTMTHVIWEQRVTAVCPERIPHADSSVDEVRFEGVFNNELNVAERAHLLKEARRVLKPGGRLHLHGLVADRLLTNGLPTLPGVAALVKRVPLEAEPLQELLAAGLTSIRITKLSEAAIFQFPDVEMREIKITAEVPVQLAFDGISRQVLYKGPFATIRNDRGQEFVRGRRTSVTRETWEELGSSSVASQFLFVGDAARGDSACG
jgi:catechol 2,3-dioxygenase-like lactoylglutathione lyase family enzyme